MAPKCQEEFLSFSHHRPSSHQSHSIVSSLEGTLLSSSDPFPYFMLLAVEAGSLLRGLLLLLVAPLAMLLRAFVSESSSTQLLTFVAVAGLPIDRIERAARVVLPRFYALDVREDSWRVFDSCGGRKVVVTSWLEVMVGVFVREYLCGDGVFGSVLEVDPETRRATGFVKKMVVGDRKGEVVKEEFGEEGVPELGLGSRDDDQHFLSQCKEAHMMHSGPSTVKLPADQLRSTAIFHDGRFVGLPTALHSLALYLYLPLGSLLSLLRIAIFLSLPPHLALPALRLSGVRLAVRGTPPPPRPAAATAASNLFVLNHRNNLDPIFVCLALGRRVPCVTYRLNSLFRLLSPIRTVALSRERGADAAKISGLLNEGDLVMCPEGTTGREPYLLRFSALFAELSDDIVPVAVDTKQDWFHGTTFHGSKIVDPLFFFMNPNPSYEVTFLEKLSEEETCGGGRTRIEVANHVQRVLGERLGFRCSTLARKDKYFALGGVDGSFVSLKKKD